MAGLVYKRRLGEGMAIVGRGATIVARIVQVGQPLKMQVSAPADCAIQPCERIEEERGIAPGQLVGCNLDGCNLDNRHCNPAGDPACNRVRDPAGDRVFRATTQRRLDLERLRAEARVLLGQIDRLECELIDLVAEAGITAANHGRG